MPPAYQGSAAAPDAPADEPDVNGAEPPATDTEPTDAAEGLAEEVTRYGFQAGFKAWNLRSLRGYDDRLAVPAEPGIYIVVGPRDEPLYVGKARNLRSRWSDRLLGLHQIGVIGHPTDRPIRVWFGTIAGPARADDKVLLGLEHSIIRLLKRGGATGQHLRNQSSFKPFNVSPVQRDIVVSQALPPALAAKVRLPPQWGSFTGNRLTIRAGTKLFEAGAFEAGPWSWLTR